MSDTVYVTQIGDKKKPRKGTGQIFLWTL